MSKEILRFRGLSLNKDEQSADHGELSLCAGVELHDGALRPSVLEGSNLANKLTVPAGDSAEVVATLLYVHVTASYKHFIGKVEGKLYWFKEDGSAGSLIHDFGSADILSVNSIGNALIVLAKTGVHYIQWKETTYKYLGTEIPFVEIMFRPGPTNNAKYEQDIKVKYVEPLDLHGNTIYANKATDALSTIYDSVNGNIIPVKEDVQSKVYDYIWALINKTNNYIAKEGHFYAPFLIRYCYRLYDGSSLIRHSAPALMDVSSPRSYRVYEANACVKDDALSITGQIEYTMTDDREKYLIQIPQSTLFYQPNNFDIQYAVKDETVINALKADWLDIVKSIDIFVSPMMVREKTGELIRELKIEEGSVGFGGEELSAKESKLYYQYGNSSKEYHNVLFDIPLQDEEEYIQRLRNTSTFYKIKSFNLEKNELNASGQYEVLNIDKNIVETLTSQELMKDDYLTHNMILPSDDGNMYVYNHRLNLYGMKERLFRGFDIRTMINNIDRVDGNLSSIYREQVTVDGVVVEVNTEQGKKYVGDVTMNLLMYEYCLCRSMLFYPDSRASRITIYYTKNGTPYEITLAMKEHDFLNGAVSTELFGKTELGGAVRTAMITPNIDIILLMPNKVITSEVDNPYYYPVEGRNTVGTGNIRGIAAVTRALSQGQVGDHDLVVFATDGIWVMKVSSEGTYGSIHNISREVCTNPKSICQLDQSVVFATERSLSRFVESNVVSMSDVLDGPIPDLKDMLPGLSAAVTAADATGTVAKMLEKGTPAVRLFNDGQVFYDYAGSRVIVLPAGDPAGVIKGVAMIYSIRDQAWSTMPIPDILAVVPGYPSPFVQLTEGDVVTLDKAYNYRNDGADVPGLIITRTLTFSDTMDVIRAFTQYSDSETAPMLFLYGSNDQRTWRSIGMSGRRTVSYLPGSTYRFFRAAVFLRMKPSEEYQQLMLEVVNKYAKL